MSVSSSSSPLIGLPANCLASDSRKFIFETVNRESRFVNRCKDATILRISFDHRLTRGAVQIFSNTIENTVHKSA